jgi:4-hydroxybenzoate polyprenyltransferase
MNIRDIKDVEGDKKAGITTIPVLLGLKKSKKIIAGIVVFLFLSIPWYLNVRFLAVPSIIFSLLSWYFITKEKHEEWKCYAVYGSYLLLIIGAIVFRW